MDEVIPTGTDDKGIFALIQKGDEACRICDYEEALRFYSLAIEENPFFAKAYYKRGMVRYLQNNLDSAEEEWHKAWKLEWQK